MFMGLFLCPRFLRKEYNRNKIRNFGNVTLFFGWATLSSDQTFRFYKWKQLTAAVAVLKNNRLTKKNLNMFGRAIHWSYCTCIKNALSGHFIDTKFHWIQVVILKLTRVNSIKVSLSSSATPRGMFSLNWISIKMVNNWFIELRYYKTKQGTLNRGFIVSAFFYS